MTLLCSNKSQTKKKNVRLYAYTLHVKMSREVVQMQTNSIAPLSGTAITLGNVLFHGTCNTETAASRHLNATGSIRLALANPATVVTYDSPLTCHNFAAGAVNAIDATCELPTNWTAGSSITPVLRLSVPAAAAGIVHFDFVYSFGVEGGDFTAPTTIATDITVTTWVADQMHSVSLTPIVMTGLTGPKPIMIHMSRSAGDTFANAAHLHGVGFLYSCTSF